MSSAENPPTESWSTVSHSRSYGTIAPEVARSWLLTAASQRETFDDAAQSGADAVILDLEDGVPTSEKPQARDNVLTWLSGSSAWVRINDVTTPDWDLDVAALDGSPGLLGVVLSKTESPEHVQATSERLPGTPIVALIESALGLERSLGIAAATGVIRLAFGSGDFRRDTGMRYDPLALAYPRARLVVASTAAGIASPIDGPSARDCHDLPADLQPAIATGMTGKLVLLPEQVDCINSHLSPSPDEIETARSVIELLGADGVRIRDGSDRPRLAEAQRVTRLAQALRI